MTKKDFFELLTVEGREVLLEKAEAIRDSGYDDIAEELNSVIHNTKEDITTETETEIEKLHNRLLEESEVVFPYGCELVTVPHIGIIELKMNSYTRWINKFPVKYYTTLVEQYKLSKNLGLSKTRDADGEYVFEMIREMGEDTTIRMPLTEKEWDLITFGGEVSSYVNSVLYLNKEKTSYIKMEEVNGDVAVYMVSDNCTYPKQLKNAVLDESIKEYFEEKKEAKKAVKEKKTTKVDVKTTKVDVPSKPSKVAKPSITQDELDELAELEI